MLPSEAALVSAATRHCNLSWYNPSFGKLKSAKFSRRTNAAKFSSSIKAAAADEKEKLNSVESKTKIIAVEEEGVSVEGVIKFDKQQPKQSSWRNRRRVAFLVGGDVLSLLAFAAIGRINHGTPVWDWETLKTADPFVAGWLLSAYFLGGYESDGLGVNGVLKSAFVAIKSWALGIPLGLAIRGLATGHFPAPAFILISMGSTFVLLVGWRTLIATLFPNDEQNRKKQDVYRQGSPFELFELLTSLVRRW